MQALLKADLFNLLCIPPPTLGQKVEDSVSAEAAGFCMQRRALSSRRRAALCRADDDHWVRRRRGADRVEHAQRGDLLSAHPPSGPVARQCHSTRSRPAARSPGRIARTDAARGVWKAPAGTEPRSLAVRAARRSLTDPENGLLNPLGINCLRSSRRRPRRLGRPHAARRRLAGRRVEVRPVRRLALFIEESLYRGTQWVVFEPNDEPLWAQIRLNVGAFMNNLFRQGAFQGTTPREAYFVKCDKRDHDPERHRPRHRQHRRRLRAAQARRVRDHQDPADGRPDRPDGMPRRTTHGRVHRQRRSASIPTRTSSSG